MAFPDITNTWPKFAGAARIPENVDILTGEAEYKYNDAKEDRTEFTDLLTRTLNIT